MLTSAYTIVYDYLALRHEVEPSDAIFCFGSRDPVVPVRAADLYHAGVAPVVVATGGVPTPSGATEASSCAERLVAAGVPRDRIVVEDRSMHTGDNVGFGVALLAAERGPVRSLVSVAWPFGARRVVATLALQHPRIEVRSVPARDHPTEPAPCTANTVRWAVQQATRLVQCAEAGFMVEQPRSSALVAAVVELEAQHRSA